MGYPPHAPGDKIWRCENHDYSAPFIYEISVSLEDWRSAALGRIVVDTRDESGLPLSAHCALSELGKVVADCWESIPKHYPQVKIIGKQVMPEHFHGLLWVKERLPCHLGQVIKGFKTGCNKAARALGVLPRTTLSSASVRGTSAELGAKGGKGLWKAGFTDTILWHDGQLANMINYLQANPVRRAVKMEKPALFHQVRDIEIRGMHFAALGNRSLLDLPLVQVQCSRSYFAYRRVRDVAGGWKIVRNASGEPEVAARTPDFDKKLQELLAAGEHGAVLLSPCISDGERQIAREALDRGISLVVLRNKGFGRLEKPSGRLFSACAAGRYLMLAPAAWPYTAAEKPMTRAVATAMNRLCQWLAGEGAAEVNYHGLQPANIDELARAAASSQTGVATWTS